MTTQPVVEESNATKPTTSKNEPTATVQTSSGAYVGLNEAKRLTGKSKDTILRHAEKGEISTILNGQGRKVYQIVDLERIFGFSTNPTTTSTSRDKVASNQNDHVEPEQTTNVELTLLREKLRHTEELNRLYLEQARRAEQEKEDWKKQADQAMRMLTYQPQPVVNDQNDQQKTNQPTIIEAEAQPKPEPVLEPKRGLLNRLFGGGK